jgi:hypothetical protein
VPSDHRTENQIDHIAIDRKFRRSLSDVRNKRGADIASDQHLVTAHFKFKIKKAEKNLKSKIRSSTYKSLKMQRKEENLK